MFPNNFHLTVPSTLQQSSSCPQLTPSFLRLLGSYPINLTSDRLCRSQGVRNRRRWGGRSQRPPSELQGSCWTILSAVYPVVG